jgi:predicted permease
MQVVLAYAMRAIDGLLQDLRFVRRQLAASPAFTALAVVIVGLGIGANATIFSFLSAVYLRTLPVRDPHRLVRVHRMDPRHPARELTMLPADEYAFYSQHASTFSGLALAAPHWMWLVHGDRSVEWSAAQVSAGYFDVLGAVPHAGRFFAATDDSAVVVLSHRAWQRTFDADPDIVGRTVRLNRQAYTVIGVAPALPTGSDIGASSDAWVLGRGEGDVFGRLRPDSTPESAAAELSALYARFAAGGKNADARSRLMLQPVRGVAPGMQRSLAAFPGLLAAAAGCLLAIICANLAGLLLARAAARRREVSIRLALGATRARLVAQWLVESVFLSGIGAVVGLALAWLGCRGLEGFFGYAIPELRLTLDPVVLAASLALAMLAGIAFGFAPAWHATRPDLMSALKARQVGGSTAVVMQVALSMVLLVSAGLLVRTMQTLFVRPGYDPERVAHFRLRPSRLGYSLDRARAYQRELIRRLEAVPGVERAVLGRVPPERGWCCAIPVSRPGQAPFEVPQNEISPGFLPTLGIPLRRGRDFVDDDRDVAIVDVGLGDKLWPGQEPVGQEISVDSRPHRVIGVAAGIHPRRPGEPPYSYLYLPLWGRDARDPRLFVRMTGPAAASLERLRREVVAVDPEVHVGQVSTAGGRSRMTFERERTMAMAAQLTGTVALLLSGIGLYGLVSYQVSRRRREIGIRMALGAQARDVARATLRSGLHAALMGIALGTLAAVYATRFLASYLFAVTPGDVPTFVVASAVLTLAALAATVVPARRAARVDPAVALRQD